MKTLAFMHAHLINECLISELRKIKAAENDDLEVILFLNNAANAVPDELAPNASVQEREFFGLKVKTLFCYEKTLHDLKLPLNYEYQANAPIAKTLWSCCDYSFYVVRHFFKGFDFYHQIQYDVFYNDSDYVSFFARLDGDETDFVASYFSKQAPDSKWCWIEGTQWLYEPASEVYGCLWTTPRMSARLVDRLYERRLEIAKEFTPNADKRWAMCEIFASSECIRAGFSAKSLPNDKTRWGPEYDLHNTRIFEKPDKCLYHPIKGDFIARLEVAGVGVSKDEIERLKELEHFSGFVKFYTHKQFVIKPKNFFAKLRRKTRGIRYPIKRFFGFGKK